MIFHFRMTSILLLQTGNLEWKKSISIPVCQLEGGSIYGRRKDGDTNDDEERKEKEGYRLNVEVFLRRTATRS